MNLSFQLVGVGVAAQPANAVNIKAIKHATQKARKTGALPLAKDMEVTCHSTFFPVFTRREGIRPLPVQGRTEVL